MRSMLLLPVACCSVVSVFMLAAGLGGNVARADVPVFDNGPFITGIGSGAGGANVSVTETSAGAAVGVSFSASLASPARAVDDFVIAGATGAGVRLANLHFYGMQTSAPTTAHFGAVYITVYTGSPATGGTPIAGDFTTNRLLSTTWSGAYRVSSSALTSTTRAIFDLNVDMSWVPALPDGQYWMMLSAVGDLSVSASANPFFFFVTPHAQGNGGQGGPDNALQLFNGSYFNVFEVPFKLTAFCPGDYNKSHGVEVQDIFDFLAQWFAGNAATDFDGNGSIGVADIFAFLNAWFSGC
jgi:hypothetical protein